MTTLKPQRGPAETLAVWAWALVALTPVGWFCGLLAVAYSHLGDVTDVSMMTAGVVLLPAAPTSAFILAVYAARDGHRSGKIAVRVSGLLLLATLAVTFVFTLMNGEWIGLAVAMAVVVAVLVLAWVLSRRIALVVSGLLLLATIVAMLLYSGWIGLAVAAVAAVLVLTWVRSRRIAVVVSGLLLLAVLAFSGWQSGGWLNVAVIAVLAVAAVLVFVWARSRHKPPPPGPGATRGGIACGYRTARRIWPDIVKFTQPGPHQASVGTCLQHGPDSSASLRGRIAERGGREPVRADPAGAGGGPGREVRRGGVDGRVERARRDIMADRDEVVAVHRGVDPR